MRKLLLALFAIAVSTGIAFADDKTITTSSASGTWSGNADGYSATIDGFTISYQKNESTSDCVAPSSDHIRVYKNAKLVIAGTSNEVITKVVLNATASKYAVAMTVGEGTATADTDAKTITWEGSTTSFEAVASSGQVRIASVVITYTTSGGVSKKSADLAFSETSISIENGVDAFTAPTFTKATTAAVTFASDNESVATVSADGVISLAGELGTAKITATAEENDEYNAGTATCTINVFKYNVYKKVTEITSGKEYLIVAQRNDSTMYAYPLGESKTHGNLSVGVVKELTDEIKVKSLYDDAFTITAVDGGYTIQDCYDRYLYQTDTYKSFNVSSTNDNYAWTVEPQIDGTFKISMNGYFFQWGNGTYKTWCVYTELQDIAVLPMLYQLDETSTGINAATVKTLDENAPVYNLAGQRVSKNAKGILIQNGKKFIRK